MTEYKYSYKDLTERQAKIAAAESLDYRMLHDNFDDPDWKHGDPYIGTMTFTDVISPSPIPKPPRSTHISTIDAIDPTKARPVRIKRVWEGRDYFYDCFVTESVKDQFVQGDVKVGDYVIVLFSDIGEQIVTAKVFKSW